LPASVVKNSVAGPFSIVPALTTSMTTSTPASASCRPSPLTTSIPCERPMATGSCPRWRAALTMWLPTPYLAKALQALTRAGLVSSQTGRRGGYRLARSADEITLLDIVLAVEGDEPAFRCTEIRQRGPARVPVADYPPICGIAAAMQRAEAAWKAELRSTTVADISSIVARQAPRRAQAKTRAWLSTQLSRAS
jgi:Rrf2 family protein